MASIYFWVWYYNIFHFSPFHRAIVFTINPIVILPLQPSIDHYATVFTSYKTLLQFQKLAENFYQVHYQVAKNPVLFEKL